MIFHIDLDCFFVAAERLRQPKLLGKAVAVGGTGARGVLSSASYEARKLGIRSAQPTAQALRLCPQLIVVPPDHAYYSSLSKGVFKLMERFSPVVEQVSIDEAYLDISGTEALWGTPLEAAEKLRAMVKKKTGLTISVGIGSNRLVAKVATDECKPNGAKLVETGTEAEFLKPLSVGRLPGCGKKTQAWLKTYGIRTMEELQNFPKTVLEKHLGGLGTYLHHASFGMGSREFFKPSKVPTVSREHTFSTDEREEHRLKRWLWEACADLGEELREQKTLAHTVRLKLRYPDFETVTRSRVLDEPSQFDSVIFETAFSLLQKNWTNGQPIRLVGVACTQIQEGGAKAKQLDLFAAEEAHTTEDRTAKTAKVYAVRDKITKKFGSKAIKTGDL